MWDNGGQERITSVLSGTLTAQLQPQMSSLCQAGNIIITLCTDASNLWIMSRHGHNSYWVNWLINNMIAEGFHVVWERFSSIFWISSSVWNHRKYFINICTLWVWINWPWSPPVMHVFSPDGWTERPHSSLSSFPRLCLRASRKPHRPTRTSYSPYWLATSPGGHYLYCLVTRWSRSALAHKTTSCTSPLCEQMDREEMGDIPWSEDAKH